LLLSRTINTTIQTLVVVGLAGSLTAGQQGGGKEPVKIDGKSCAELGEDLVKSGIGDYSELFAERG